MQQAHEAAIVLVYDYQYWDPDSGKMLQSRTPATLESIMNGLGVPVRGSGRKVHRTSLDAYGRCAAPPEETDLDG